MTVADFSLVPKLHLGTPLVPAKFHFALTQTDDHIEIGNGIASASAFPSATWERGYRKHNSCKSFYGWAGSAGGSDVVPAGGLIGSSFGVTVIPARMICRRSSTTR